MHSILKPEFQLITSKTKLTFNLLNKLQDYKKDLHNSCNKKTV